MAEVMLAISTWAVICAFPWPTRMERRYNKSGVVKRVKKRKREREVVYVISAPLKLHKAQVHCSHCHRKDQQKLSSILRQADEFFLAWTALGHFSKLYVKATFKMPIFHCFLSSTNGNDVAAQPSLLTLDQIEMVLFAMPFCAQRDLPLMLPKGN